MPKLFGSILSSQNNYLPGKYYFFDISSRTETGSYQVSNPNGQLGTTNYSYTANIHELELVYLDGSIFGSEMTKKLNVNDAFYKRMVIPPGSMDSASDWINPVYVSMYLAAGLNPQLLQTKKEDLSPCDIGKEDTIYLGEILNREHVVRELWGRPKERKFKTHLKYFKHNHIKLRSNDFAARAIQHLSKQDHFYYYFFDEDIDRLMIIDALEFKVIYFPKVFQRHTQQRRYVKRCSKVSSKCKH